MTNFAFVFTINLYLLTVPAISYAQDSVRFRTDNGSTWLYLKGFPNTTVVRGEVVVSNSCVQFNPRRLQHIIKSLNLCIDDIAQVKKLAITPTKVIMQDGCTYKLNVPRRKNFIKAIKENTETKDSSSCCQISEINTISGSRSRNSKLFFYSSGFPTPFPLHINGSLTVDDQLVDFAPQELPDMIKRIQIPFESIKSVKKRRSVLFINPNKLLIETKNGDIYRFKSKNRNQLVDQLRRRSSEV